MTVAASLIARYERLFSSLVSDCIEDAGYGPRAAAPGLQPYHSDELRVVVGPAHTCDVRRTSHRVEIDAVLAMVDAMPVGSVVVVAADEDVQGALWGGLMSAAIRSRGGIGAVVDGGVRDLHQILPLALPVFAMYRSPLDIRGRGEVVAYGGTVDFRGVSVRQGELVFADANGVVVIPDGAELEILERCEERLAQELQTQTELDAGRGAREVYDRHRAF